MTNIRQGDLAFIGVDKLPEGLEEIITDTLLQEGSGGNPREHRAKFLI